MIRAAEIPFYGWVRFAKLQSKDYNISRFNLCLRWQADISLLRGKTRNVRTRYLMPLAFAAIATTTLPDRYTSGGDSERIPGEVAERGWGNQ